MSTFPFGRWKGRPYADVPDDYFRWCLTELKGLQPETRRAIERERARRRGELPLEDAASAPELGALERKVAAAEDPVARRILEAALAFVRAMGGPA